MLSLHTNYASLSTQNALGATQKTLTTSMSAWARVSASTPPWTMPPACRSPPA
jgi:hypothetical protein